MIFYKLLVEHSHDFNRFRVTKGTLEFLEPVKDEIAELSFVIGDEDAERLKELIGVVHKKILALDFPDISAYDKDLSGIMQFENDLLEGNI